MEKSSNSRASFSGKLGYVLATAGSAVGLGNIWRFPYLAAKYGGGIFILVYIVLAATFGYTMMVSETALGRRSKRSPIGAFATFSKGHFSRFGGWINAVIPVIIVPYYSVIGGWVLRYLIEYLKGNAHTLANDEYFAGFITNAWQSELCFVIFALMTILVIVFGVKSGVERVSKIMMPSLAVLAVIIAVYSVTRPGAIEGVKFVFIPDFSKFSFMTVVAAMGQMFYSLSIAMGILYTYGSYMKKEVNIESATYQVAAVDSIIAIFAVLMIIPSVFAFSPDNATEHLQKAGPSLLFVALPKVFDSMGKSGAIFGTLFFVMVLFAALTSSISLLESSVSTLEDEFKLDRKKASAVMIFIMIALGTLSSLGFNKLDFVVFFKGISDMSILDFFDFLTNSIMMPISAFATVVLILRCTGINLVIEEVQSSSKFRAKGVYVITLKFLAPVLLLIILISSVLNAFGIVKI